MPSRRGLLRTLAYTNFRVGYKRAYLGMLWVAVQPTLQALVLVFVLKHVLGLHEQHYALFVLAGLLPWSFFAQGVVMATTSVVDNTALVRRFAIPRSYFPLAAVGGVALASIPAVLILIGGSFLSHTDGWRLFFLPVAVLLVTVITTGVGLLTCALHVAFRDVRYALDALLALGFYATPIIYGPERLPHYLHFLGVWNPLSGAAQLMRWCVLGLPADHTAVAVAGAMAVGVVVLASQVFVRRSPTFADYV